MIGLKKQNNIHKSLGTYFRNEREFIPDDVFDFLYSTLIQNIDCDEEKLVRALQYFNHNKKHDDFMDFQCIENKVDISKKNSSVSVKAFHSKENLPILYFYRDSGTKPVFKISKEIEHGKTVFKVGASSDPELLSNYKNLKPTKKSYYLQAWEVETTEDDLIVTSKLGAKTCDDGSFEISKDDLCDEYKNFYNFLSNTVLCEGRNALSKLNPIKADIIFSEFYQNFKELNTSDSGFCASDLVLLMNLIYAGNIDNLTHYNAADCSMQEGRFSGLIDEMLSKEASEDQMDSSIVDFVSESGEVFKLKVSRLEKYLSVDFLTADNKVKSNYMFTVTNEGFSVFRLLRDKVENMPKLYTLNLYNNQLKLMVYDEGSPRENGRETVLTLCENGDVTIVSAMAKTQKLNKNYIFESERIAN
ncbi:MAG: hypothetical protein IKB06_01505 [Clostridia bacterium]|nr:hypothetical protein [Clostridia bacterium]